MYLLRLQPFLPVVPVLFFLARFKKYRLIHRLNKLQLLASKTQLSDRYIANIIYAITDLIRNDENKKAGKYLDLFDHLTSQLIDHASKKLVPLRLDLDILENYLELEQVYFKKKLHHYELRIDMQIDPEKTQVPPMIFQELVRELLDGSCGETFIDHLIISVHRKEQLIECTITAIHPDKKTQGN